MLNIRSIRLNNTTRGQLRDLIVQGSLAAPIAQAEKFEKVLEAEKVRVGVRVGEAIAARFADLVVTLDDNEKTSTLAIYASCGSDDLVTITFPSSCPVVLHKQRRNGFSILRITTEEFHRIKSVEDKVFKLRELILEKTQEVRNVVNGCNTTKQIIEAYPEWAAFFPDYLKLGK